MKALGSLLALGAALVLAFLLARSCEGRVAYRPRPIYAPWEEGLTLQYEDPSLEGEARSSRRLQLRVARCEWAESTLKVTQTYSTLHNPPLDLHLELRDGGVMLQEGGRGTRFLPEGFPDRVCRWEDRGMAYSVLGRAEVRLPGLVLPAPQRQGVWVEGRPLSTKAPRTRVLYLDGVGEAQRLVQRDDRWVCVNQLVARSFTDAQPTASGPAASAPAPR